MPGFAFPAPVIADLHAPRPVDVSIKCGVVIIDRLVAVVMSAMIVVVPIGADLTVAINPVGALHIDAATTIQIGALHVAPIPPFAHQALAIAFRLNSALAAEVAIDAQAGRLYGPNLAIGMVACRFSIWQLDPCHRTVRAHFHLRTAAGLNDFAAIGKCRHLSGGQRAAINSRHMRAVLIPLLDVLLRLLR